MEIKLPISGGSINKVIIISSKLIKRMWPTSNDLLYSINDKWFNQCIRAVQYMYKDKMNWKETVKTMR